MRKTTVRKLRKAGVCSRDIMAITGHRNDQSLADYDQLDLEEYCEISHVFSSSKPQAEHPIEPQPGPSYQPQPIIFQSCTVYFWFSSWTVSVSQSHTRKQRYTISDSDSD